MSDGVPFSATFGGGGDPLGLNNSDPFDFPDRLTKSGCSSLVYPGNPTHYIKTECFAVPSATGALAPYCDAHVGSGSQCFNLLGNTRRNSLRGPGVTNVDFSIYKNNRVAKISEDFNVQFRAEAFNILNHPNFAPPSPNSSTIFDSNGHLLTGSAGQLTGTQTTERQVQLAVKVIW